LQQYGVVNILTIILVVGIMTRIRKIFLDKLLKDYIKDNWLKWLIRIWIAFILSFGLSILGFLNEFNLAECIKQGVISWICAWIFHDAVKNLFFRNKVRDNNER
jgi:hypothetical protein